MFATPKFSRLHVLAVSGLAATTALTALAANGPGSEPVSQSQSRCQPPGQPELQQTPAQL